MTRTALTLAATAVLALGAAACGGDSGDDEAPAEEATAAQGPCAPVQEVDVEPFGSHRGRDFTAADYETNPPAGGDHSPQPLAGGTFYTDPPRLGEAVHLLEHGAVIGWTNDLPRPDEKAVEEAFNEVYKQGYSQLATVENPELEAPFALSAWGFVQACEEVDTSVIRPFIEDHYAPSTSGESSLACQGPARKLPPCRDL